DKVYAIQRERITYGNAKLEKANLDHYHGKNSKVYLLVRREPSLPQNIRKQLAVDFSGSRVASLHHDWQQSVKESAAESTKKFHASSFSSKKMSTSSTNSRKAEEDANTKSELQVGHEKTIEETAQRQGKSISIKVAENHPVTPEESRKSRHNDDAKHSKDEDKAKKKSHVVEQRGKPLEKSMKSLRSSSIDKAHERQGG
ncbi:unnamed protein product, partial [Amoebophrya sp. A25]